MSHLPSIDLELMYRLSRRQFLQAGTCGFGMLALAGLAAAEDTAAERAARGLHFPARARRVIFMFMQGGPSHVDTFDYKPELERLARQGLKTRVGGESFPGALLPSPWKFSPAGESGLPISELFPHVARHADKLCLINSMVTDNPAHPQATIMLHTGSINFVRPSMGAWIVYGLGTENTDLPGFVVLNPLQNLGGAQNYGSAFLPASHQATQLRVGNQPMANLRNRRIGPRLQRAQLDLVQQLNRDMLDPGEHDAELEGVISSYELAFRMQSEVPELMDITDEPASVRQAYGIDAPETRSFGTQCLMARRLAEAGVRFIEITHRGWDQHNQLTSRLPANCQAVDQPIASLLEDLQQRGLLADTLVVWGGEFGRTPAEQNNGDGRRHNHHGFTMWMAGGGVRGGMRYGATDPTGYDAVEKPVHTHDLHATILYLLGLDHTRLTFRYSGRDFRLTDVYGRVVDEIVA